jgi:hypothetical protein
MIFLQECLEEIKLDIVKPTANKRKAKCYGRILGLACVSADETMQEVRIRFKLLLYMTKAIK